MPWKVVFVGPSFVGKTSLIRAFMGKEIANLQRTVGVDLYTFKRGDVDIVVWDLAGQEWYHELVERFIRGAHIIVLVFDLSNPDTLQDVYNYWADMIARLAERYAYIIVVGNKKDIAKISDDVLAEFLDRLRQKIDYKLFIKTSALTGENVAKLFDIIFTVAEFFQTLLKRKK